MKTESLYSTAKIKVHTAVFRPALFDCYHLHLFVSINILIQMA